jgi:hypothetical protein
VQNKVDAHRQSWLNSLERITDENIMKYMLNYTLNHKDTETKEEHRKYGINM